MKLSDDSYVTVFRHEGYNICALKNACPAKGDRLGYVIDDELFYGQEFSLIEDAIQAIEQEETDFRTGKVEL